MGKPSVTIKIDKTVVRAKLKSRWDDTLFPLSSQVLADMNEYVRVDQNVLRASSTSASDFDKGILRWNTPYARRVYYTGNPSKDVNPNASLMWCEVGKANHNREWITLAEKLFGGGGK